MCKHLPITGLCCGLAFALLAPAALAQTTGQMTDHQRIEALEARVAALERRLGMTPTTPQPASQPQSSPATPRSVSHLQPSFTTATTPTTSPRQPSPAVAPTPATSPRQPAATVSFPVKQTHQK